MLNVDAVRKRISLARIEEGESEGDVSLAVGNRLTGTVERVENFGVFVRLGPGVTGLVPNSELSTPRGSDHNKQFPTGTKLEVVVMENDEQGRLRLSRKAVLDNKEKAHFETYKSSS